MEQTLIDIIQGSSWGAYVVAAYGVLGALVTIATIIAPFTSTPVDDKWAAKAKALWQRFSVLSPKK